MFSDKLVLGTVQFGLDYGISNSAGQTSNQEAFLILEKCIQNGIHFIDTARSYGISEEVIGNFNRDQFSIISKFYIDSEFPDIQSNLDHSLTKLKAESIYAYIAHDADQLLNKPELWDQLQSMKSCGKINKIGYSLYHPDQLEKLLELNFQPDLVQVPYNILDRRFESGFPFLQKSGCEIHTRSAFLQGLFFMNPDSLVAFFDPVRSYLYQLNDRFPNAEKRAQFLLEFCINNRNVNKIVFGVNTVSQLKQNLEGFGKIFKIEDQDLIQSIPSLPQDILIPSLWPAKVKL